MKRILFVLILLMSLTAYQSKAQNNCTLPQGCSWSGPSTVTLYGCLTVEYYYTICNDVPYFKLGNITANPPCPQYAPSQVIRDAGEAIIQESWLDAWKLNIPINECVDGISGFSDACYHWTTIILPSGSGVPFLTYCTVNTCCISYWKICRTGGSTWTYYKSGSYQGVPCPPEILPPYSEDCFGVCEGN